MNENDFYNIAWNFFDRIGEFIKYLSGSKKDSYDLVYSSLIILFLNNEFIITRDRLVGKQIEYWDFKPFFISENTIYIPKRKRDFEFTSVTSIEEAITYISSFFKEISYENEIDLNININHRYYSSEHYKNIIKLLVEFSKDISRIEERKMYQTIFKSTQNFIKENKIDLCDEIKHFLYNESILKKHG